MVNNKNPFQNLYPKLTSSPELDDGNTSDRYIQNSPIWELDKLIEIIQKHEGNIKIVTDGAKKDFENLLENGFNLIETLLQVNVTNDFRGAFWCKTSPSLDSRGKRRGPGSWIPCDSYSVKCEFENPVNGFSGLVSYYIKLCQGIDGNAVLFVSIHV